MADNNALRRIPVELSLKANVKPIGIRVNGTKKSSKPNVAEAAAPLVSSVMPDVPSTTPVPTSVQTSVPKGIPKIVKSAKTDVIQSDVPIAPVTLPVEEVLEVKEDTPPVKKKYIEKPIGQSVAAAVEVLEEKEEMLPVMIRPTLSQGDCFYSSIFRSLQERDGLLEKIGTCLTLNTENETIFIQSLRNKIAERVVSGNLPFSNQANGRLDMYDSLVQYTNNAQTYTQITKGFPEWFKMEFGKHGETLGVKESFCQRLASHIRTSGEWVGEIEVQIAKEELERCNVTSDIRRSNAEEKLYKTRGGNDVIYLYNPSELHYEYFSFDAMPLDNVPNSNELSHAILDNVESEDAIIHDEPFSKYRFDPEFGTPVATRSQMIKLLQNALKELESNARKEEDALAKKYEPPKTLFDLLTKYVLHPDFDDPLSLLTIQFEGWTKVRSKTSMFEALWNIIIGLGFLPGFPIEHIQLMDWRGVNKMKAPDIIRTTHTPSKSYNILSIFKHMKFGTSASGVSDITFLFYENPDERHVSYTEGCTSCEVQTPLKRMYISSVKFFELDMNKNIENFDISPLLVASGILTRNAINYDILLFVKDSNAVSNIVEKARKSYLTDKLKEGGNKIFGESHLKCAINSLRQIIRNNLKDNILSTLEEIYGGKEDPKSYLSLRFHQELMVEKTNHYISTTSDKIKQVLIGVLPRGGKTYICGGIISKIKPNIVLVLTHVPKETHKQFLDDLFYKFNDFLDYKIIYLKDEEQAGEVVERKTDKMIIFTSYQLIKTAYALKAKDNIAKDIVGKLKRGEINETTELDSVHDKIRTEIISQLKQGKNINETTIFYPIRRTILRGLIDKSIIPDMCFFDEAHFGNGGTIAQEVYKTIDPNTIRILMTATYIKPYYQFNIKPTQLFHWDYQDIQLGKNITNADVFVEFRKRHLLDNESIDDTDTIFDTVITSQQSRGNGLREIQHIYAKFPNIELITTQFEDKAIEAFEEQLLQDSSKGISMNAIFSINSQKKIPPTIINAYTLFSNPSIAGKLLNYISPTTGSRLQDLASTPVSYIEGDVGSRFNIMDRIYQDSYWNGNRLSPGIPHTQIWFIPPSNGIQKRIMALASLLLRHPWFSENFCIMGVYGGESDKISQQDSEKEVKTKIVMETFIDGNCFNIDCGNVDDLKKCIEDIERENRCIRKKGTIILTGFMLRMGISLGCADVVMLLDDDVDPDATTQKTFRALTESEGKKKAYVVDMNPQRSIHAICQHIRGVRSKTHINNSNMYRTVVNTFGINTDRLLFASPGGKPIDYTKLYETIREVDESVSSTKYLKKLETISTDVTSALDDPDIIDILSEDFKQSKLQKFTLQQQKERKPYSSNNESNIFTKGIHHIRIGFIPPKKTKSKSAPPTTEQSYIQRFEIFKQIIDTTLKLIAFTYESKNIREVYEKLSSDNQAQDLVVDTLINRGLIQLLVILDEFNEPKNPKKYTREEKEELKRIHVQQKVDILTDIITSLEHMIDKRINDIYRGMKEKANDPTADQQDVLKYIEKYLAPTTELKDEYGEVFTPMWLVNEMLDKLEEADPNIFKDKTKKWLDPANGMGNFPVAVFYRLMKQLHGVSQQHRAEHIVKNMLYMMEYRKENTAKCKRIFTKLAPDIEPNIITVDSLQITYEELKKKGWPTQFDVIMGNPPFNSGGTLKGGGALWPKFVNMAFMFIKPNGYICFVHPPGWRKFYDPEDRDNQGKLWHTIKENGWNLDYINISDQKPKHFPIVDYYVIHAKTTNKPTKYNSTFMGIINLGKTIMDYQFIPNMVNDETISILKKLFKAKGEPIRIIYNQAFKPSASDKGKPGIPHYHFTARTGEKQIYKKKYASVPEYITKQKVIMTYNGGYEKGKLFAFYSDDILGTTNNSMYMLTTSKAHGDKLVRFFNSDIITFLMKITQYTPTPNNKNEFKILNQLEMPESLDDYKLTAKEEELIKKVVAIKTTQKTEKVTKSKLGGSRFQTTRKTKRT